MIDQDAKYCTSLLCTLVLFMRAQECRCATIRRQAPLLEDTPTLRGFLVVEPLKRSCWCVYHLGAQRCGSTTAGVRLRCRPRPRRSPQAQAPSKHPQAHGDILTITPMKTLLVDVSTVHPCAHTFMCHAASRAALQPGTALQPANDITRSATTTEISEA